MAFNDRIPTVYLGVFIMSFCLVRFAPSQDENTVPQAPGIEWHKGPYNAHLGGIAIIKIPKGYAFTDAAGTK